MKNFSHRLQGLITINITAVIFGSAALYGKLNVSPVWIVAMRAAFAAATFAILRIMYKDKSIPPRHLWLRIAVTGVVLAAHWLTFFTSVQLGGVAVATLTFATFPLFTVIIEAFSQKRRPHMAEIAAAATIIAAVSLLVGPRHGENAFTGAAAGLGSALLYAVFWHSSRGLSATLPPRDVTFFQNAAAALSLVPFLAFASPAPAVFTDWLWLALLGIVNTALMLQLYLYALRRISASTCSGFVALEPVYAILLAALFFHEPLTLWVVVSAMLIIGASFTLLRLEAQTASPLEGEDAKT